MCQRRRALRSPALQWLVGSGTRWMENSLESPRPSLAQGDSRWPGGQLGRRLREPPPGAQRRSSTGRAEASPCRGRQWGRPPVGAAECWGGSHRKDCRPGAAPSPRLPAAPRPGLGSCSGRGCISRGSSMVPARAPVTRLRNWAIRPGRRKPGGGRVGWYFGGGGQEASTSRWPQGRARRTPRDQGRGGRRVPGAAGRAQLGRSSSHPRR